jgi:hypothetical protein
MILIFIRIVVFNETIFEVKSVKNSVTTDYSISIVLLLILEQFVSIKYTIQSFTPKVFYWYTKIWCYVIMYLNGDVQDDIYCGNTFLYSFYMDHLKVPTYFSPLKKYPKNVNLTDLWYEPTSLPTSLPSLYVTYLFCF